MKVSCLFLLFGVTSSNFPCEKDTDCQDLAMIDQMNNIGFMGSDMDLYSGIEVTNDTIACVDFKGADVYSKRLLYT